MTHIVVDAMGGDNAPGAVVEGVLQALSRMGENKITLVGDRQKIEECLGSRRDSRLFVVHAPDVIEMAEPPVEAIRKKKESSMVVGLTMVANGEGDVFLTAGSTGATIAGATMILRRLKGVGRPALAPVLPTATGGGVLLIDCGANVDCKPRFLQQFGIMGSIYMAAVLGVENPRVGLINNGAEEEKGNELTKAAYPLLAEAGINFKGNAEGRELLSGEFDVLVCDGFVGNVVMKFLEGAAGTLMTMIKGELLSSAKSKIGALLSKNAYKNVKKKMDYTEYGGAPLLGVRAGVIKAHGSSNAKAIANALKQAEQMAENRVVEKIAEQVEQYGLEG